MFKLILKQIFNTLLKNIFLVAGLFIIILTGVLTVVSASSLSISLSNAQNSLNNDGNKASVVSDDLKSIGQLNYQYDVNSNETNKIYVSTINLVKNTDGNYYRNENTLFPYEYSDFYFLDETSNYQSIRKNILNSIDGKYFLSGIKINYDTTDINNMFEFNDTDYSNGYPIWKSKLTTLAYVALYSGQLNATSYSLIDDDSNILLNPQYIMYNAQGRPITTFVNGEFNDSYNVLTSISNGNENILKTTSANDKNHIFDRCIPDSNNKLHNSVIVKTFNKPFNGMSYIVDPYDSFYIYKEIQDVNSYRFKLDISSNESDNIFKFINYCHNVLNLNVIEQAFNLAFYNWKIYNGPNVNTNKDVVDSLYYDSNNDEIVLSVSDNMFIDLNSNIDKTLQIINNKEAYLKKFSQYLSNIISKNINVIYQYLFKHNLLNLNIELNKEKEYLYNDTKNNKSLLFVEKSNNTFNNIVLSEGQELYQNTNILSYINMNNFTSEYINLLFILKKYYIDLYEVLSDFKYFTLPETDPNKMNNNTKYFSLLLFCLNKIIDGFSSNPNSIYIDMNNVFNKEYILFNMLMYVIQDTCITNFTGITLNFDFLNAFNTVSVSKIHNTVPFLENYFCNINNSYLEANNKKVLPSKIDPNTKLIWDKMIQLSDNDFEKFLIENQNSNILLLDSNSIINYFHNNFNKYLLWINYLNDDYKIFYKNNSLLIIGSGLSADYMFPVISLTSSIPNPDNEGIIYINQSAFNNLGINNGDIDSYLSYGSHQHNDNYIINQINNCSIEMLGIDNINATNIKNAKNMKLVWIRSNFPSQLNSFIIIISIALIIFIFLLSVIVSFLLIKTLTNNLIYAISSLIANGVTTNKIMSILIGIFVISNIIFSSIILLISTFLQSPLLGLFSSVIFMPINTIGFNPILYFVTIIFSSTIIALIIYIAFKLKFKNFTFNNINENNKILIKINFNKIKISSISMISISFVNKLFWRLLSIGFLGSMILGTLASTIIINNKFIHSQLVTNNSRNYNNQIDLVDVNYAAGQYKTQEFEQMGITDSQMGINSLYSNTISNLPTNYKDKTDSVPNDNLLIRYYDQNGNAVPKLYNDGEYKYFANLVLPSYYIYNQLNAQKQDLLFNSIGSLFSLNATINFGGEINIWSMIRNKFPEWLVFQMENQLLEYQQHIMYWYGEKYYDFLDLDNSKIELTDNDDNLFDIVINTPNLYINDGYYYAEYTSKNFLNTKKYKTLPFYVWSNNDQKYLSNKIADRYIVNNQIDSITLTANNNVWVDSNNNPVNLPSNIDANNFKWYFVPAYNQSYALSSSKSTVSSSNFYEISYNQDFLYFLGVLMGDVQLSQYDTKISFGIVPYNSTTDEKYTRVDINIVRLKDDFNHWYTPAINKTSLIGIKPNSNLINLTNRKNNDISHLLLNSTLNNQVQIDNNDIIPVIINEGAKLEWNLEVNDIIEINVNNNALMQSYKILNQIIPSNLNPNINTEFKLKVVGICDDSYGTRLYINQDIANKMLNLNDISIVSKINSDNTVTRISNSDFVPFNGIFTNSLNDIYLKRCIPFYSYAGIWNLSTNLNNLSDSNSTNLKLEYELLIPNNSNVIDPACQILGINANDINVKRELLINYLVNNTSLINVKNALTNVNGDVNLLLSISTMMEKDTFNNIFNVMANLVSKIVYLLISILLPLFLITVFIISFSMSNDISKWIGIFKILGYNSFQMNRMFIYMYLPFIIMILLLGIGIMFGATYGLQFLIYNVTSIFITEYVNMTTFIVAYSIVLSILMFSIMYISLILKKQKLTNLISFN